MEQNEMLNEHQTVGNGLIWGGIIGGALGGTFFRRTGSGNIHRHHRY